ncbi:hypothetical protein DICA3_F27424 [Diutina catenulata]
MSNPTTSNPTTSGTSTPEDTELNEIWSLFQDSPADVQRRRQKVTKAIQEDTSMNDFPGSMSIVTALDELLGCFALGGQVKNYYRYGTYDTCVRQRQKFWFAVANGSFSEETKPVWDMNEKELAKREKIQGFYKKRLMEDKARGSSEDIWEARTERIDPFK